MSETTAVEQLARRQLAALDQAEAEAAERAATALTASERAKAIAEADAARCAAEAQRCAEQAACQARQRQAQADEDNRTRHLATLRAGVARNAERVSNLIRSVAEMGPEHPRVHIVEAELATAREHGERMRAELNALTGEA
jgi:hypothetical protein